MCDASTPCNHRAFFIYICPEVSKKDPQYLVSSPIGNTDYEPLLAPKQTLNISTYSKAIRLSCWQGEWRFEGGTGGVGEGLGVARVVA